MSIQIKGRSGWQKFIPAAAWIKEYSKQSLQADLVAGLVVAMMLIPQSLAYALLAGMPPETGLYASILPLVVYALFGSSRTLSVGPVAIVSLMTMATLSQIAETGSADYVSAAILLAFLSGLFLLIMGLLKFGFVANFLSHTVVSGFITASGIIIALSQLSHILGIRSSGHNLPEILVSLSDNISQTNFYTLSIGLSVLLFLFWSRKGVAPMLTRAGLCQKKSMLWVKAAPVVGVILSIVYVAIFDLEAQEVAIIGAIPSGLPRFTLPVFNVGLLQQLCLPALSIALIGYVESVSVGKTLAAKRRQKIDSNQELVGLGAANIASSMSGAFPVTGGLSRTVVNFDAGAVTQAAGIYAAIGIGLASLFLSPVLYFLPKATLAATIVIAVLALLDFSILKKTWRFSRSDFLAVSSTILGTLFLGVEIGVALGLTISLLLHLYRTSIPHIAEVGLIAGTQHFRNINRFQVVSDPNILNLRVDESLFFANAHQLEDAIYKRIYEQGDIAHVILICSAINEIDFSALEVMSEINDRLSEQGIVFNLSEVKGPVMDSLRCSGILETLSGKVYLTQYEAFSDLSQQVLAEK